MDIEKLLEAMTPEIVERLMYATETGRWPEGGKLSQQQRDSCMQAVMLYQSRHNSDAQHMSVAEGGEVAFKSKAELKGQFSPQQELFRVKVDSD
ncbi:YeaC family protein [Vibrio hippocampi]|uniref:DUF1315 domain-containing protein n=1 Tax=Vibrio hippocampi TaxID=654686 RepID=A0ABM8ZJI2_9VIBR|nr:DUF1315 family protein [Vibrio hippocampi]CAH0526545.1 hypothetical protein VHP8226_01899 [Vibrio hippocampi]